MDWWHLVLAITFNLPVGYMAYRRKSLTFPGGVLVAGTMGLLLYLIHPLYWILLIVFFSSSTLLTHYKEKDEFKIEAMSLAEKGGRRDSRQVLANGGIPTILAMVGLVTETILPIRDLLAWYSITLVLSFAVVNADTWATELGVLSNQPPRWILNPFKSVPRGSSGGISLTGLFASLLAALLIGLVFSLGVLVLHKSYPPRLLILITLGGLFGSLLDSLLGATIQVQYYCSHCDKLTEQSFHKKCNSSTEYNRGLIWFSNDLVNVTSVILTLLVLSPFFW